jgi:hypothetical protein
VTDVEKENKYKVYSMDGKKLFEAKEKSDMCARQSCGPSRPFDIKVEDKLDDEKKVMSLHRPLRCQACCFPCCLQEVEVEMAGEPAGSVRQQWNPLRPCFLVSDPAGEAVLRIEGPACSCDCCSDVIFVIYMANDDTEKVNNH